MPPNDNLPRLPDGSIDYDKLAAMSMSDVASSTPTPTPSGALGSASNPYTNNSYVPQPRDAYGPYLQGDIANRTVQIDAKTRADPYTGQRYTMGSDNTWRESGFLSRTDQAAMRSEAPLAPVGEGLRNSTVNGGQMSANPSMRPGAATAGMAGGLGPQDTPHFSSLSDYRMPGLGFDAGQFRQVNTNNIDLGSTKLPTAVATRPYGFDFGTSQALGGQAGGARTSGPAMLQASMPNFQVPNSYQSGPSGFSIPAGNGQGSAFAPVALPFGASNPTFSPLTQSAPAQVMPGVNGGPATAAGTQPGGGTGPALGAPNGLLGGGPSLTNPQISQPQAGGGLTVNGVNLPQQSVDAVMQSNWSKSPEAIPQALALMARESGGRPEVDNSKGYQGGPLNNDPKYGNAPGSAGYNSIDYGLFGINSTNFGALGLNPQSARDPVANANAAYQLYENAKGWSPWTGGGTVPLPAPATNVPALPPAGLKATTDNPYFLPSAQQLAGQPSRATAGNPYYLPSAAQLGQEGKAGLKATPSDPYFLPTPDQLRLGAGSGGGAGGAGGAAGAGGAGAGGFQSQAIGQGTLQPAGMLTPGGAGVAMLNGPQTVNINGGLSPDGKTSMGFGFNPSTILQGYGKEGISNDAATRAIAAMSLMNTNSEAQMPKAQGGMGMTPLDAFIMMNTPSTSNYGAPQGSTNQAQGDDQRDYPDGAGAGAYGPDGPMRFAAGGTVDAGPGMQLPLDSGRATPAVVAPLDNSTGNMAQPRYTPQGQQQAQQATYLDSTAQAAAPSNSEGAIAPISNQGTTSQPAPTAQNTALPQTMGGGDTSGGANYNLPTGAAANDPTDALAPFRDALTKLGVLSRQRASDASRYSAAGLSAPTAIDTLGGGGSGALPPGLFYDPTNQIQGRVSDIVNLQNTLAQLGNPGSVDQLTGQMVPLQQLQSLFGNIDTMQNQLKAYGQVGDPSQYLGQMNSIDQLLARYNEAQGIQTKLTGLGNIGDPNQMAGQLAGYGQQLNQYQQAEDLQTKLAALGNIGDTSGVQGQMSSLQQLLAKYSEAQGIQTKLSGLGQVGDPGQLNTQIQQLQSDMSPYEAVQALSTKIQGLGPQRDPAQIIADMQTIGMNDPNAKMTYDDYMKEAVANLQRPDSQRGVMPQWEDIQKQQAAYASQTANLQTELNNSQNVQQMQLQLKNLDPTGQAIPVLGQKQAQLQALQQQLGNAQNASQLQSQYQNQLAALGLTGDINQGMGQTQSQYDTLKQQLSQMQAGQATQSQYQNQLNALGLGGQSLDQLYSQQGQVTTQRDALQQQYQNALQQQQLQQQYQNQLSGLVPQGQDINQAMGGLQAQRGGLAQQLSDAQKAQELQMNMQNLQAQTGGQTEAGVQSQLTNLTDALSRARQAGTAQSSLSNLLAQGVPGAGKLPGFAQGGRIQAGNFGPGANDVQGYQRPPDSSGKNLAEMMRGMGGLGVTAGQWDPNWNIKMNPAHGFAQGGNIMSGISQTMGYAGPGSKAAPNMSANLPWPSSVADRMAKGQWGQRFASGGSMTTPEEIVGIGKYSGKPYFRVGEAGPERLTVQPLTGPNARPSKIPMGVMNRAAA